MYRTITAKFDSIETAEIAARSIKEQLTDIQKISIKTLKRSENNDYSNGGSIDNNFSNYTLVGTFLPYNSGFVGAGLVNSFIDDYTAERTDEIKEATLEICCIQDDVSKVHSILTCHHGLNIKEN